MSIRMKLLALLAVLACAVVAGPQLATGAKTTSHTVNGTLRIALLQSSASGNRFAGSFTGTPAGAPAVLGRSTITGTTAVVRGRLYGIAGTVKFENTQTFQPQPDGSINFTGSGKFTGGTGRYAGASGRTTFNGTLPAGGSVYTFKVRGKIRY
jgi:hypothetical protein